MADIYTGNQGLAETAMCGNNIIYNTISYYIIQY